MSKKPIGIDVLTAARKRISDVFDFFPRVYLSLSGGKDSGVMLHLAAEEARNRSVKFGVLIVDLEAQYALTISHVKSLLEEYSDVIEPYWVALPIALRNAVSVYEPKWMCWDSDAKSAWVRQPDASSITDEKFFPFFERGMEFEDFVPKFGEWYSNGQPCACLVGIRTDESLNRYRTIASKKKKTFGGRCWTTKIWQTQVYNCYPIYDWRTKDIWTYFGKTKKQYNRLYDLMNQAGLSIHQQRICQPYGDDQRKGLWLYHVIEPETWARVVARVSGANSGAEFVQFNGNASGQVKISKPDGHTWQSFCGLILDSLPEHMAEHYRRIIENFLSRGNCDWHKIAKMLLRNDYNGNTIGMSQSKEGFFYKSYMEKVKTKKKQHRQFLINRGVSNV
jgi:predicted phosphoadenosine phosphosulfate sulfurtransferase